MNSSNSKKCQCQWTYLFLPGKVKFLPPKNIREAIHPGQSTLTSLKNSTDQKCHLARWKFCSNNYVQDFFFKQECIPVGCVPPAAVAVSRRRGCLLRGLGVCSRGVCSRGVSAPGGGVCSGGCLLWGVGYPSMHLGRQPLLWTDTRL